MIIPVWLVSVGLLIAGVGLLIQGVRQLLKFVGGPVLLKLPLTQKNGQLVVVRAGEYAIWQSGATLQRVPVSMQMPIITEQQTGQTVLVQPIFSSVRVNTGGEGRIQLFGFWAKAGTYTLEWSTNSLSADARTPYFLQIRERKPVYWLVGGVLLLIVGAACLIASLILPVSVG